MIPVDQVNQNWWVLFTWFCCLKFLVQPLDRVEVSANETFGYWIFEKGIRPIRIPFYKSRHKRYLRWRDMLTIPFRRQ